jgi:hypothetical protein
MLAMRGPRGSVTHDSIMQEEGRERRLHMKESVREWLFRRYECSMFRERNMYVEYAMNYSTRVTRRNFACAYRQSCVHRRLQYELEVVGKAPVSIAAIEAFANVR